MSNRLVAERIFLTNFRNYESFELGFDRQMTLVVGENGCGKTSVIEGVYLACVGKSFRSGDEEILRRGAEYYRVELVRRNKTVVVRYDGGRRVFEVGGRKYGRLPAAERYPVVLFLPSDLHLVMSSPARKRDYFDGVIAARDEGYHRAVLGYNKALRQRNELLKGCGVSNTDSSELSLLIDL